MKSVLACLLALALSAVAKDKEIPLASCPAPVQATVKYYTDQKYVLEKTEIEKDSDPKTYGAKFNGPNGLRFEVIIAADGKVLKTDAKKPKKEPEKAK